jgi:site-specific recombinase XerD
MRIERAIDAYLDWRQLERDATPRSIESYRRILFKLAEEYPEANLASMTTADLRTFLASWVQESKAERGIDLSASTRSNIISVLHSFFAWAEAEDIVDVDPSRKIRRPPNEGRTSTGRASRSSRSCVRQPLGISGRQSC